MEHIIATLAFSIVKQMGESLTKSNVGIDHSLCDGDQANYPKQGMRITVMKSQINVGSFDDDKTA